MNPALVQQQIQLPYSRDTWRPVLRELLPNLELFAQVVDSPLTNEREREIATARRQFGRATLADGKIVALYEIDVVPAGVDLLRNRVALRQLIARCIDQVSAHAVLAFFAQPGTAAYRLTYASRESTFDLETLALETRETAPRRFTYVLGPGETRRTAAVRLAALAEKRAAATLTDVTGAFSVERLNKEFFDTYRSHYGRFCEHLLAGDAPARVFSLTLEGLEGKVRDRTLKPVRDFVKKLLGRLVFLHFLQKKGWLGCPALPPAQETLPQESIPWTGGQSDFLRSLFHSASAPEQGRFHSARLVPLFFDTLNDPCRPGHRYAVTGTRVPYLNGGLFERDFVGVERLDFPAALFRDLLDFFGQYHFTIDENDPEDHEIGIDPEMLGHIFENLLEDNKDKGAYYTPKAVVQYMAQQSLIHTLAGRFPDDSAARGEIEAFIRHKEPIDPRQADAWLTRHATRLAEILDGLKICDPAIGSGAFPIGLLQEIYWTQLTLNPALDRAAAKRAIIQRSIHGVDFDAGAVEIARLRFWLALVVDEPAPVPLPNLDYQIMQGNSLLESFEGERLDTLAEPMRYGRTRFGSGEVELDLGAAADVTGGELTVTVHTPAQHDLADLQRRYFACHEPEAKARLRAAIDAAVLRAIDARLTLRREEFEASLRSQAAFTGRTHVRGEERRRAAMQAELDALAGKSERLRALLSDPRAERPFFLWHLWFREVFERGGGFDIVIANPPYVRHEAIKQLKPVFEQTFGEFFTSTADLFVYFYHRGITLLRRQGLLCFISSNKFFRAGYGRNLRDLLTNSTCIEQLVDFGELPVFAAGTDPAIIIARRDAPSEIHELQAVVIKDAAEIDALGYIVAERNQSRRQNTLRDDGWTLEKNDVLALLTKLRRAGRSLDEVVSGRFYYGVKTGLNAAFVVDRSTRDLLVAEHGSSADILKPFVHGADAKKWSVDLRDDWLIRLESSANVTHPWTGQPLALAEETFRATFPAIHRRFAIMRDDLIGRDDQGTYFWELRSCAYWQEFQQPKIIYNETSKELHAFYDEHGLYTNKTLFMLVAPEPKPLLAILLSQTLDWLFRHEFPSWGDPWKGGRVQFRGDRMATVPVPEFTLEDSAALATLVDGILAAKRAGNATIVARLETEIDTHVFRLYGLTPEEIQLVRDSQP